MGKISVVIQTYNAEKYLERVLRSMASFDEVLICDMHSTDRTLEIAEKYGCRVVFHKKEECVEPARNFAIHQAAHEWVLVVDADELVTKDLHDYLYNWTDNCGEMRGLWIPRKDYLFGRFMHGDYPDYILRFFRKDDAVWPPYIHSMPKINGKVGRIPKRSKNLAFIHLINNPVAWKVTKMNTYSSMEIEKRSGQRFPLFKMFYAPAWRFLKSYVVKGGFRDGKAGLVNAWFDGIYKFLTIAKIWESQVRDEDMDAELKEL